MGIAIAEVAKERYAINEHAASRKLFINQMGEAVNDYYSIYFDSTPSISAVEFLMLPNFRELNTEKYGLIMLE